METREYNCFKCPNGCHITVRLEVGAVKVSGASCVKGESFAYKEATRPMRMLTATVKTAFPSMPRLPVRTRGEIRREDVPAAMAALSAYVQTEAVKCGDVIIDNLFGCPVAATSDLIAD